MTQNEFSMLADIVNRLERIEAKVTKPEKNKKDSKPIETPEQFMARMRAEFKEMLDFDEQVEKCKDYYRIKQKMCRRDSIEDWLIRERKWRVERGIDVPGAVKKHGGLVL